MTHAPRHRIAGPTPVVVASSIIVDPSEKVERYAVELVADGNDLRDGLARVRLKRWLKVAKRTHGLQAVSVAPVPAEPTGHLAVTNADPGYWKPTGRAIRRALAGPLGQVRPAGRPAGRPGGQHGPAGRPAGRPATMEAAHV